MIIITKIINLLEKSELEVLFNIDLKLNRWVWLNRDTFQDLVLNVLDYDIEEEDEIFSAIKELKDSVIIEIVRKKMKKRGWVEVNQNVFQELEAGFNTTKDIETYVFVEKKLYMARILSKIKEMQWTLKAMAIDYYQHLSPENNSLQKVFDEMFSNNDMIIEELLQTGEYVKNTGKWKYNKKANAMYFYKNGKNHRQWAEGNANFIFYELNR